MEAKYVSLSACAQKLMVVNMLLEEISEVQKALTVSEDNHGDILLANNRQVGM